ncbi:hypothetical protein DACRYDRAFT_104809 [Dacryopinax primogenitus]|uniref:Uncharacterized protein n=1 Tax=Dacryopinax primogenitus (strain DJM 731) TaxID=1858805 RepID=M5G3U3_DACPD|nr:uncharacterized protein DACRYDRAFT_104809 [Dacryopinax primogenitus]EJU04916.1 hypothetical protein DACRYDRAFT_104809 [Dacryopinax primogenitus]
MPLNLKETPAERAERAYRKDQRAKRKRPGISWASERPRKRTSKAEGVHVSPEGGTVRDVEDDAGFRRKKFDELAYDAGQDSAQAAYARHVPSRWGRSGAPAEMEEEEYAEWVRRGMWRRTHMQEVEEAEAAARQREEREKERRAFREREKREARERERRREVRRREKELKGKLDAWEAYERGWGRMAELERVRWEDVPWPVFEHPSAPEELTGERMREFLFSDAHSSGKGKKERVREALLRWHPDKFEGRWMGRVREGEREMVREGMGRVVRFLGELGKEKDS